MQTLPTTTETEIRRRERTLLLLAAAFVVGGSLTLHLAHPAFSLRCVSYVICSFAISFATAHVTLSRRMPRRDPLFLPTAAFLTGWGLLMVGRLAPDFLPRQVTWLLVSTLAMLGVIEAGRGLRWLRRYRYTWLAAGLTLLTATLLLGVNPSGHGPRLWLRVGGVYFQPSEPLKLLMVIYLASYLAERWELLVCEGRKVGRWHLPPLAYVGPLLVMFGLAVLLLAGQQDLGAAMLFFLTFLTMLYLATGQWEYVVAALVLFLLAGAVGYTASTRLALRVDTWLNPWPGAADRAFQVVQSLLAFGAGGFLGEGLGMGRPTYIPAVHTDFVFAGVGEEFGLMGVLAMIALYGILLLRGFRAAAHAPHAFERLLAAGLTGGLVIQAWVIMAGNAKLAPIAGVTLPFVSYGGSSLLSTFVALGLLLRISNQPSDRVVTRPASQPLLHTASALSLALVLVAATCGYWAAARAGWLVARKDNPRGVEYEQRLVRGRILDRNGVTLADVEVGPSGIVTRTYPVPEAAPVVGYASLRYGTGVIEASFDEELRGEAGRSAWEAAWADLLHSPPKGQDVQLTVDADLQRLAQHALAGEAGAGILLDARTGEVLAMASAPTFDPARLDEEWERLREDPGAPLVNRATQGLYQPGAALQTIVVAEAVTKGFVDLSSPAPDATDTVTVNNTRLNCRTAPVEPYTLADAFAAACPAPVAALGERLGANGLTAAVERWELTTPLCVEIPTVAANWDGECLSTTAALRATAVGQSNLTVSPLQMGLVAGALANEGTMAAPRLVLRVQDAQGEWQRCDSISQPRLVLPPEDARELLAAWHRYDNDVAGHWSTAAAGEGRPHAWFIGVLPAIGEPRYAVAVLVEHASDPQIAMRIGLRLLQAGFTR